MGVTVGIWGAFSSIVGTTSWGCDSTAQEERAMERMMRVKRCFLKWVSINFSEINRLEIDPDLQNRPMSVEIAPIQA